ncbi:MAG TPA: SDR family NAD(P)-dependent oxidoreductase [Candidatus Gastranaerophilales bacterium]|nr:SDR family NAD(P)-dependent oxidoreductase [Candidatus Gastranaerophilales bacterium]
MGYALILGGNSDLGKALAEKYAFEGYSIYLADSDTEELEKTKQYIAELCEAEVQVIKFNVLEFYTHRNFYKDLNPKPIGAILAVDYIGDQKRAEKDFLETKKIVDINYTGLISILNIIANDFKERKEGFIAGIGSILGEENKQEFYTYSAAKQGFIVHLEGLNAALSKSNVQVLEVDCGFVQTISTKDFETKEQPVSIPRDIAENVFKAQQKGKNAFSAKKNMGQRILSLIGKRS